MKAFVMLAAVATSALLLIPTVATAQTVTSARVSSEGLNLTVPADRNRFHARLARTIDQLCAEPGMRGINRMTMERACVVSTKSSLISAHLALNGHKRSPRG
jgi:UrcA family protein